jgi:hypothetical protein
MTRLVTAIVGALMVGGVAASAHHSYDGFYRPEERTVAVDGTLENLLYANPHIVMKIRAADGTVYTVTWQASNWAQRVAGVTRDTFKTGDRLVVIGTPARDATSREVTRIQEVRRPSDGWTWRSAAPFAQPS